MRPPRMLLLAALAATLLAGCGDGDGEEATTVPGTTGGAERAGGGSDRVELEKVGDFDEPVYVTQAPGGEDLYVVEQGGRVRIVRDSQTLEEPFLDLSDQVISGGEQGLLSIAFAPDYESSRLLYAYFTGRDENQHVVEFSASGDGSSIDPDSAREVLVMEDFAPNHNGGLVLFGPDGGLYIGTGDGGGTGDQERNGQDLGSLLGKLLRIDPRQNGDRPYGIPADNPFVNEQGARPEVYSYGLRNPWRFSFDRDNQALSIGDVGQSEQEEIDYVPAGQGAGANFGWSAFEGSERFNGDQQASNAIPPVLTYPTADGCAVTGGYVVRDPSLPSLTGRYLYGDYCKGELRSFVPSSGGAGGDRSLGLTVPMLSSFGEDSAGRIYAVSLNGPVFRLIAG